MKLQASQTTTKLKPEWKHFHFPECFKFKIAFRKISQTFRNLEKIIHLFHEKVFSHFSLVTTSQITFVLTFSHHFMSLDHKTSRSLHAKESSDKRSKSLFHFLHHSHSPQVTAKIKAHWPSSRHVGWSEASKLFLRESQLDRKKKRERIIDNWTQKAQFPFHVKIIYYHDSRASFTYSFYRVSLVCRHIRVSYDDTINSTANVH